MPKISDLPADTAPDSADLIPFVDVDAARTESVTVANLAASTAFAGQYAPLASAPVSALRLPGLVTTDYVTTPYHADLALTSEFEIGMCLGLDVWTPPSTAYTLLAKTGGVTNRQFVLQINSSGRMILLTSAGDGTGSFTQAGQSDALGFTAGESYWLWFDWRASDGRYRYHTAPYSPVEPPTADRTLVGSGTTATSVFASTAQIQICGPSSLGSAHAGGKYHRVVIHDTIDGDVVADWRSDFPYGSVYRDVTGKTWTTTGSGSSFTLGKA